MSITNSIHKHTHTHTHTHVGSGGRGTGSGRVMRRRGGEQFGRPVDLPNRNRDTGRLLLRDSSRVLPEMGLNESSSIYEFRGFRILQMLQ